MIKEFKGGVIDQDFMKARKRRAVIVSEPLTLEEIEEGLKISKEVWIEIIKIGQEFCEKELLDYHQVELTEEVDKLAKKKKKILTRIKKKLRRDHTFHYLSGSVS